MQISNEKMFRKRGAVLKATLPKVSGSDLDAMLYLEIGNLVAALDTGDVTSIHGMIEGAMRTIKNMERVKEKKHNERIAQQLLDILESLHELIQQ